MENGITKPAPKLLLVKEFICLTKHIHLRILIKHTCSDKLIKDTNSQWRQKGKDDIETRHGP
jgi:hypothetical protein